MYILYKQVAQYQINIYFHRFINKELGSIILFTKDEQMDAWLYIHLLHAEYNYFKQNNIRNIVN